MIILAHLAEHQTALQTFEFAKYVAKVDVRISVNKKVDV